MPTDDDPEMERVLGEYALALDFADLFRAALYAISAFRRAASTNEAIESFLDVIVRLSGTQQTFSFHSVFEQAIDKFGDPPDLDKLDTARLKLARAGLRLLATQTDCLKEDRQGHADRLARAIRQFDAQARAFEKARGKLP